MQAFGKIAGKLWNCAMADVSIEEVGESLKRKVVCSGLWDPFRWLKNTSFDKKCLCGEKAFPLVVLMPLPNADIGLVLQLESKTVQSFSSNVLNKRVLFNCKYSLVFVVIKIRQCCGYDCGGSLLEAYFLPRLEEEMSSQAHYL